MSNPTLVHGKRQSLGKTIWKHRASYLLMAPYFILFFFFTVLPVLMAIGVSFTDWNMLEKPELVGWQNYVKLLLDDEIFIISLKNTLIFAVITGPVSYMLCLLFAWIINEFNRGMRTLLTLIFYAPSICGNAYMVWNLILTGDRYGYLNGILLNLDIINEPILWMKTEQYVMPMLIIVQLLGFNTTSLVALLAASGFGIGMALSGTLQNFAGGIMVMFMHPYRIGDYIEAQGQAGTVKEIRLFSTVVTTTDNKRIIPNSSISNAIVNNYSSETMRRVEWKVSLAYGDDVAVAKRTMLAMLESDKRVLHTPDAPADPFVALSELADSAIVVVARTWTLNGDYWDLFFDMNERFYNELPQQGLHFPFPQLDVHLDK
mgnify:FL=1